MGSGLNCLIPRIYGFDQRFSYGLVDKESVCNAGDRGDADSIPGSGRSPGGGNGNPLQYSCLENSVDIGAWRATVHCVVKTGTRLSSHSHSSKLVYVNISDIF